ncbi:serine hydrolase domain-containing protein [Chitinilyticum litopenaei]|uniref:serine hydrolase domain-containing protein n=1 Tax=Chitinilyticum litopenaei TaxID=1121276 RepID=UPI00041FB51C|nr:serine hydrolase [Chitinilyticum litopenaei]
MASLLAATSLVQAESPELQPVTPESVGLDSEKLAKMLDYLRSSGFETESVLVARHGQLVLAAYHAPFRPGMPHQVNSVTKSVTSTLVGLAISDGKLKLTDTVGDVLPQYRELPGAIITVEQLLQMKTGMIWIDDAGSSGSSTWETNLQQGDWIADFLRQPMDPEQRGTFNYNSGGSALLAVLAEKAVGQPLLDYGRERLFKPLGIEQIRWVSTPDGTVNGGRGLYIAPADMLRFGELFRQNGEWQGRQIIPAAWVQDATSPKLPVSANTGSPYFYGSHWWVGKDRLWFSAQGWGGQYITVYPQDDITLVVTSRRPDADRHAGPIDFTALREYFLTPAANGLPAKPAAQANLQAKVASWASPTAVNRLRSPLEKQLNGRKIDFSGDYWLSQLQLEFRGDELLLGVTPRDGGYRPWRQHVGLDGKWRDTPRPAEKDASVQSGPESLISGRAQWLDRKTLLLETLWLDESWSYKVRLRFSGNKVRLERVDSLETATGTLR